MAQITKRSDGYYLDDTLIPFFRPNHFPEDRMGKELQASEVRRIIMTATKNVETRKGDMTWAR